MLDVKNPRYPIHFQPRAPRGAFFERGAVQPNEICAVAFRRLRQAQACDRRHSVREDFPAQSCESHDRHTRMERKEYAPPRRHLAVLQQPHSVSLSWCTALLCRGHVCPENRAAGEQLW